MVASIVQDVPVTVFATRLSPAEALVKYLKEQGLRLTDIGRVLNRDQRGIWSTYRRASLKHPEVLVLSPAQASVPVSLFQDRKLSVLEHVVHHFREKDVQVKVIASWLGKNPSTIASVHHRARKKLRSILGNVEN